MEMEELFKELSKFARENREALKLAEQWLNEFDDNIADAWEVAKNGLSIDWKKIVFTAWLASDEKIYECKFIDESFDVYQWCPKKKDGRNPQRDFLHDVILKVGYDPIEKSRSLLLIRSALEEGKKAQGQILPNDLIRITVAIQKFHVSKATIKRNIKGGTIKSYRLLNSPKNSHHLVSESELAKLFTYWK